MVTWSPGHLVTWNVQRLTHSGSRAAKSEAELVHLSTADSE